jgi:drug/metabolite transporter (DMT)-like permease
MAFVTMWFANLAEVNPGIITVIWALGPLYMAAAERCMYKIALQAHHWIGVSFIVICAILIALSGVLGNPAEPKIVTELTEVPVLPAWAPVVMAVLTPIWFTTSGILVKHMTGQRREGDPP